MRPIDQSISAASLGETRDKAASDEAIGDIMVAIQDCSTIGPSFCHKDPTFLLLLLSMLPMPRDIMTASGSGAFPSNPGRFTCLGPDLEEGF